MDIEQEKNVLLVALLMALLVGASIFFTWIAISDDKWKCEADLPDYVECIWSPPPSYSAPIIGKEK